MATQFRREDERAETLAVLARAPACKRRELIEEYERRSLAAFAPETLRSFRQIVASFTVWAR